jgi:hypothetical protein
MKRGKAMCFGFSHEGIYNAVKKANGREEEKKR